jgi:hypothetical protein
VLFVPVFYVSGKLVTRRDSVVVKPRENRVPIMMSEEELKDVDDWRFANRVATRSEAIRRLVQVGLILDGQANNLAAEFVALYDYFGPSAVAAAEKLPGDEPAYIAKTFTLAIETIQHLESLLHRLNQIMSPLQAIKAEEPYEAMKYGLLSAKADALARHLQQKINAFEFKKEHGMLPEERDGAEE